jgi:hypothetical protein
MLRRKLKKRLKAAWGRVPDAHYFAGDMDLIRVYADYRAQTDRDAFFLDDITWNDLDMDRVFQRMNPRRSTSGEQYLYYMLRSPTLDRSEWEQRRQLIGLAAADGERRLRMELILARLGCTRRADLCRAFAPARRGVGPLLFYLALLLLLLGAVSGALLGSSVCLPLAAGSLFLNFFVHEIGKRHTGSDFDTVNYTVNMVFALRRLQKLRDPELDRLLAPGYESLGRLRAVLRTGGVSAASDGAVGDVLTSATLLDLITYEFLKNKLGRKHDDVFAIHEALGRLDAAVAIASWRAGLPGYALPALDFAGKSAAFLEAEALVHPLLPHAVPNDLKTEKPLLVTGSNASGKSTFLKTAALAAILAQSACTVPARSYRASAFRVYSSMALRDDLAAGESYYIVETRSLKRILNAARLPGALLCVVDEVLRGTNTVERIAASCELLGALAGAGALCLAATHDIELCALLSDAFRLAHFEEQVGEEAMLFDYRLREGAATSRNAIELLRLMGFDKSLVENAHARADRYLETGQW